GYRKLYDVCNVLGNLENVVPMPTSTGTLVAVRPHAIGSGCLKVTGKTTADTAFSTYAQSAEELIHELVRRPWAMVGIGRKTAPAGIAAYRQNNHEADVIMQREQILALIANGTDAEQRIRRDRARLVPFALLQGATALDVARALGDWTRDELQMTIGRWTYDLRR